MSRHLLKIYVEIFWLVEVSVFCGRGRKTLISLLQFLETCLPALVDAFKQVLYNLSSLYSCSWQGGWPCKSILSRLGIEVRGVALL